MDYSLEGRKVIYQESSNLKVVPFEKGFNVVEKKTNRLVNWFPMLWMAEETVFTEGKGLDKGITVGSAAEVRTY